MKSKVIYKIDDPLDSFIYSWRFSDEPEQSKYQIEVQVKNGNDGTVLKSYCKNSNIVDFHKYLYEWRISFEMDEYLEYLFNAYPGDKKKWLRMTELILQEKISMIDSGIGTALHIRLMTQFKKPVFEAAAKWVQEKKRNTELTLYGEPGLETLFIKQYSASLITFLIKEYSGAQPKPITIMLFALFTLGYIVHPRKQNKAKLHRLLKNTFGEIGTEQAYKYQIKELDSAPPDEESEIQSTIMRIKLNGG